MSRQRGDGALKWGIMFWLSMLGTIALVVAIVVLT